MGKGASLAHLMFCGWEHPWNMKKKKRYLCNMYSLGTYCLYILRQTLELFSPPLLTALLCVYKWMESKSGDPSLHPGPTSLTLWPWPVTSPVSEPQFPYLLRGLVITPSQGCWRMEWGSLPDVPWHSVWPRVTEGESVPTFLPQSRGKGAHVPAAAIAV